MSTLKFGEFSSFSSPINVNPVLLPINCKKGFVRRVLITETENQKMFVAMQKRMFES